MSIEGLVGRLVERVERREFEVWETSAAGQPCFMVAAALSRHEAVGVANRRARDYRHPQMLVLDGRGNLVHRV